MNKVEMNTNPLQHLQEKAIRAHYWISFSPERRGEQMVKDYGEELAADMEELQRCGASNESIADYKRRYETLFNSYLHAKSGTFSAMITGPARFNTCKHAKANRSEERHYEIFRVWREKAKKAIIRKAQPAKTYNSELERYQKQLAELEAQQAKEKAVNKRIREAKAKGEDLTGWLINEIGVAPHMVDWAIKFGYGSCNTAANIRRVKERIAVVEKKEEQRQESPEKEFSFEGGKVVMNYEVDRIQIFFDKRPTPEELAAWKAKGLNSFNWSPSVQAWQRKITPNAIWATKRMLKI